MKFKLLSMLAVAGLLILPSCGDKDSGGGGGEEIPPVKPPKKDWVLIWEDTFDKDGAFDPTKWEFFTRESSDWSKYIYKSPKYVYQKDGQLVLRAELNTIDPADPVPYHTGAVSTHKKFAFKYGKIEVRARFTKLGQGSWPAIWMMPEKSTYGGWPKSGEIDIMEHVNLENQVHQTVHTEYTYTMGIKNPDPAVAWKIDKAVYNTYGLIWSADRMQYLVNGQVTHSYPRLNPSVQWQWPFDQEFYLILNNAAGGGWTGPVKDSDLPFFMEVDWVKVYQFKEVK